MVFAVSPSNSGAVAVQPAPPVGPRPTPQDLFNTLDTGSKGYLTQADLQSAIVNISDQGAKLSAADAQAKAKDLFAKIDANGDGKASLEEFKQAAPPAADAPPAGAAQAADGKPPAGKPEGGDHDGGKGGKGGKPGAGGGAGAGQSSTSYDPADTNKDGVVSDLERLAYTAKHMSTATQAALKAYQAAGQSTGQTAA